MIIFENDGILDLRAIKTFGISAKEVENPIGYFGTGLKYAIAILLRENQEVRLITGGKYYSFRKITTQFRGKDFETIQMNGEDLPFTTELGKNWKLWQAFREIYCNCLDERGTISSSHDGDFQDENRTYFVVRGDKFDEIYEERNTIVLNLPKEKLLHDGVAQIYNQQSRFLYYRGIQVAELTKPSIFTYNLIGKQDLTEDRTLKYLGAGMTQVSRAVSAMKSKYAVKKLLTASPMNIESEFSYSHLSYYQDEISPEFSQVLEEEYKANTDALNVSARTYFQKMLNSNSHKNFVPAELNPVETKQLARAKEICLKVFPDFGMYPIHVAQDLGEVTMAYADLEQKRMIIGRKTFHFGTKYLTSTLIEEYMHLKTGHHDLTRELQTHLFDTICTLIENHVLQEPI